MGFQNFFPLKVDFEKISRRQKTYKISIRQRMYAMEPAQLLGARVENHIKSGHYPTMLINNVV